MKYLFLFILFTPNLWAQICWDGDVCSEVTPIVPYIYVTPVVSTVPWDSLPRYSAPIITMGVTPNVGPNAGPATIMRFPDQDMTHIIQQGKVTTCFTIGQNTVVCQ